MPSQRPILVEVSRLGMRAVPWGRGAEGDGYVLEMIRRARLAEPGLALTTGGRPSSALLEPRLLVGAYRARTGLADTGALHESACEGQAAGGGRRGLGQCSSQPAMEAAQSAAPPASVRTTAAFLRAGPRTSITAPLKTVPAQTARSTPSESASAGAATTRNGVSAQCRPHQAAGHVVSRDPEARYALDGQAGREFFIVSHQV